MEVISGAKALAVDAVIRRAVKDFAVDPVVSEDPRLVPTISRQDRNKERESKAKRLNLNHHRSLQRFKTVGGKQSRKTNVTCCDSFLQFEIVFSSPI